MADTHLHWFKQFAEFRPIDEVALVPTNRRGLYVLYKHRKRKNERGTWQWYFDVVYVGMATAGIKSRLKTHRKSKRKGGLWTHFSAFEVYENVRDEEIRELEGLFRHFYRMDSRANKLNRQKKYAPAQRAKKDDFAQLA